MSYLEQKDPLTGKGKRHTASAFSVLGLSKSVIEEERYPSKGEIQEEDKDFWLGEALLQQGELLTWNRGNDVAIVNSPKSHEIGNKEYNVVMLEPYAMLGQDLKINIEKIVNIRKIQNEDKELKESDEVIVYWRDMGFFTKENRMEVGIGRIVGIERNIDKYGVTKFPGFIKYKILLLKIPSKDYEPMGYIIDVYEHVGYDPLSSSPSSILRYYKTNRIWRKK